ncbi:MAG: glycosyltransferase [Candidatus Daviesbacteria bacterium]|nr:MAG: glycosyltransferase [Candidatus Daviesbacteria bacterium]
MSVDKLSVFFPAFNEEANIQKTIADSVKVLTGLTLEDYEIVVVDDGSKDKTREIVENFSQTNRKIKLVAHPHNLGYGAALKTGFKAAKFSWVAFADSDGQFDFGEIKKLLEKADQADLVLGYRLKRMDSFSRIVGAYVWNVGAKLLLGLNVRDYSCGFKLIKKQVFEKVQPLVGEEKVTQIEFLVKARRMGFKILEVGVHHYPRKFGTQTGANLKVVAKSYLDLLKLWWVLLDKKEFLILMLLLGLTAILRFYRLPEYMTFLGDEGRDALVIKKLLVERDLPFIGPPTSIGNIYLGPLYYYMMAIPMAIFWLNPVAAAYQVAVIGILTVWLIYHLTSQWFSKQAGLVAAFLYSISPVNIIYSRSSWNPNPAPFFALLCIFGLYKIHQTGNFRWLILSGGALAFVVQMHYLALILIPIAAVLWLHQIIYSKSQKRELGNVRSGTILAILVFLILMSPLLLFDLKHNFMNFQALQNFFGNREATVNLNPVNSLFRIVPLYQESLIGTYLTVQEKTLTLITSVAVLIPLALFFGRKIKDGILSWPYLMLGVWLAGSLLGLALYKQNVYAHYLGFVSPVPFILLGSFYSLAFFYTGPLKQLMKISAAVLIVVLAVFNLQKSPLTLAPNNQLQRTQDIAKYVIEKSADKPFNFALIAKNNYDAAYQFYLGLYGYKPAQIPFEITEQLFVVCEDPVCEPIGHPKQEISHFGWAKVEEESQFRGVKVFKLIHNPSGKPPESRKVRS